MKHFILLVLVVSLGCKKGSQPNSLGNGTNTNQQVSVDELQIFFGPNARGHIAFVNLINSASKSIYLSMFRLTENSDVQALIAAAKRQIKIKIILDREATQASSVIQKIVLDLKNAGVEVKESTTGFSITHEKAMSIDGTTAIISTMNMTMGFRTTRDVGVITKDLDVVSEFNAVFEADWINADNGGIYTPPLTSEKLLWSPNNSTSKLTGLIRESTKTIDLQVENFTNDNISNALIEAAGRNIQIRILTPLCSLNPNPLLNIPTLKKLSIGNIQIKVMPNPATAQAPYIHAKTLTVDRIKSYVGSINFSNNSLNSAREVGIIFKNQDAAELIRTEFEKDWIQAIVLPIDPQPADCL